MPIEPQKGPALWTRQRTQPEICCVVTRVQLHVAPLYANLPPPAGSDDESAFMVLAASVSPASCVSVGMNRWSAEAQRAGEYGAFRGGRQTVWCLLSLLSGSVTVERL